ncbi:MAG: RtcB family protein [Halopenitus sp.]
MKTIEGEYTDAKVLTTEVDEACIDQITEMVNHEAFTNPVKIMPDAHAGAGAVIGFTMPLGEKVVPNTVGVDIGCGMAAAKFPRTEDLIQRLEVHLDEVDNMIQDNVPMGHHVYGDDDLPPQRYSMEKHFPWGECERKLKEFNDNQDDLFVENPGYGMNYFKNLCLDVEYSFDRAENSIGTLGGGNHFIEIAYSEESGHPWVVIHSGSRGLGSEIAETWQKIAHQHCNNAPEQIRNFLSDYPDDYYHFNLKDSDMQILDWVRGEKNADWKNMEVVAQEHSGEEIERTRVELEEGVRSVLDENKESELDYLEGDLIKEYIVDMIFAQTYAKENRREMIRRIACILNEEPIERFDSIHNYIDFQDSIIRKGATPARKGERALIPFNMADGSVIIEGKGNSEWNNSAPHGAGRRGSRGWARQTFSMEEFEESMDGVYSTSVSEATLDEVPMAYKEKNSILSRLPETAEVVDTLTPILNIKAQ